MALLMLFLFAAFFAVFAVEEPLSCSSTTGLKPCNGTQDVCLSIRVDTTLGLGQTPLSGGFQSCAEKAQNLDNSFLFDFGDEGTLNIASKLCNTTVCNAVFPDIDLQEFYNGKYCPKCYKPGASSCVDNGTVSCIGDYEHCSAVSGVLSQGDTSIPFAAKGCASKSVKELSEKLPRAFKWGDFKYNFSKVSFEPANGAVAILRRMAFTLDRKDFGPQVAFFFPYFLGILVVKLLS